MKKADYVNALAAVEAAGKNGYTAFFSEDPDLYCIFLHAGITGEAPQAGGIMWRVQDRYFKFTENDDPRLRRTGDLYKILDALRKDLYMDDYFRVYALQQEGEWLDQYEGVFAVLEVEGGEPKLTGMCHMRNEIIRRYNDAAGCIVFDHAEQTDLPLTEEHFFRLYDEIRSKQSAVTRTEVLGEKVLEAYRNKTFNLKDFYSPLGPRPELGKTSRDHGGHWDEVTVITDDGTWEVSDDQIRIRDYPVSDSQRLRYLKEHPEIPFDLANPVWVIVNDMYGVRRRKLII